MAVPKLFSHGAMKSKSPIIIVKPVKQIRSPAQDSVEHVFTTFEFIIGKHSQQISYI